jgi:hypothetical protein
MPVSIKVVSVNPSRLAKVRRELRYLTSEDFFRTIPLKDFQDRVQEYLKLMSPVGDESKRQFLASAGYRVMSARDARMAFSEGWRVKRQNMRGSIRFEVSHLLESKGKKGRAKFAAVEYGSKASTWIASRRFRFKGDRWAHITPGRKIEHAATQGANAMEKTSEYIQNVLLPLISDKVNQTIRRRLA